LRERIAAAIHAEPQTVGAPPVEPIALASPAPATEPIRLARWWAQATPWMAAALVLLVLSAGLLVWNVRLREEIARVPVAETIALVPTDAAPGASGQVTYRPDERLLRLDVRDLPPLAPDQVYEVWLIAGDDPPQAAGVFADTSVEHALVIDRDQYDTLAITAEPGPLGTAAPTGEIVATAAL
jgi:anti-sigma-K factor RskA